MSRHETKYCPQCAAVFECKAGTSEQCQCSDIQLTDEQRIFLEKNYTDCLCRNCLLQLQKEFFEFKSKFTQK
jgi:hypothetical protein